MSVSEYIFCFAVFTIGFCLGALFELGRFGKKLKQLRIEVENLTGRKLP